MAPAQELLPLPVVQPVQVFHLRPEGLELEPPPPAGRWRLAFSMSYGNTWSATHHLPDMHVAVDPPGSPLSRHAVAAAEAAWPADTFYFLDAELMRLDIQAVWSPTRRWSVGMDLPWLAWGGTSLDVIPDHLHAVMGVTRGSRPYFPTRRTVIYVKRGARSFFLDRPPEDGPGQLRFWSSLALGRTGAWEHRIMAEVKAPTAEVTVLGGNAWDWGLRWAVHGRSGPLTVDGGIGWTRLGGGAPTLAEATDAWHAWGGARLRLWRSVDAAAFLRADTSVYWHQAAGQLHKASLELGFGPIIRVGGGATLALTFGENIPAIGLAPDFSLHAGLTFTR